MTSEEQTQGWEEARAIAVQLGEVPSLFSTCIRGLMTDSRGGAGISRGTRHALKVLMLGGNFRAAIYHAGLTFRPNETDEKSFRTPDGPAKAFPLEDLAHLIALLFAYRRLQKNIARKHEDRWPDLAQGVLIESEIGGHLGIALPKLGFGWGLMVGAMRHLAQGLLLGSKPKDYHKYRIDMKVKKEEFDLAHERAVWGCTHLQVATLVLQTLGMGVSLAQSLEQGYCAPLDNTLPTDVYRIRIAREWIMALKKNGLPPEMTHRGDFYPLRPQLEVLQSKAKQMLVEGSQYSWIDKGKEDAAPAEEEASSAEPAEEISGDELKELEELEGEES